MTYLQARTANEVLKAQERKMRLQKLRGELVDRARAVAMVFRLARQERDAWAGWPARVAAMMAAELGLDP
ncbi:MAG: elements of external origin, partial [Defluviicoccus sp.]